MDPTGRPEELLRRAAEFLAYCEEAAKRDVDAELREIGLDPAAVAKKGEEIADRCRKLLLAREREAIRSARQHAERRMARPSVDLATASEGELDAMIAGIQAGRFGSGAQAYLTAHFRNFQGSSGHDKRELLKDMCLVNEIWGEPKDREDI